MKKDYQKPAMRVIELKQKTHLLAVSGEDEAQPNGYDDDFSYAPGTGNVMNHLA